LSISGGEYEILSLISMELEKDKKYL
jgi:hypothetical protein